MWASAAAPPLKPWQPNAISAAAAGPSSRRRSVGAHCHRNREETTTFKSEEPRRQNDIQLETKGKPPTKATREKKLELQEQRQFSGVDVLKALQKATPRKLRTRNGKKESCAVSDDVSNSGIDNQAASRLRNLRSLRIKPEWSDRLEELERRLSEVAHR